MTTSATPRSSSSRRPLLAAAFALCLPVLGIAKEPSADSLEKLLKASEVQKTTLDQMDKVGKAVDAMINEAVSKQKLTPAQLVELKKRLPDFAKSLKKIITEEMGWAKVKENYANIYASHFTQEEVDGLIAFYQSTAGKAFLKKMPKVTEEMTQAAIERLPLITERVQKASEQFLESIQTVPDKK